MHDITDAYNAAISEATTEFYAAMAKAWDVQQAKIAAAEQAFEKSREARLVLFYAGPAAMPKADVPEDVAASLDRAVEQAANDAGAAPQQIAAE